MNFPDLFDAFDAAVLPPGLPDAVILRLRHDTVARELAAGEQLDLDPARAYFAFLGAGACKLAAFVSSAREQIVSFHFTGDVVHVPAQGRYGFTLTALTDAQLLVIPAESLNRSGPDSCGMLRLASRETENALARSRETSIILGRRSAQERVASFIVAIWDRLGADSQGEGWIDLPMSRGEIADSLGLTIETVSRQFSELRDLGLIETEGRSALRVIDLPGLSRCAGQLPVAA
ncbi:Crp/Fnr family transcriptional regulator [Alteriqipengyuania lutimaris]|uniref:Crp/Fnr family transcriptional regulator n=1 Tax=Alteriqipengyuania lutimaris TaxID=1538146 RepID=UPI001CFC8257|nr:helix-turn-helix domain-containing protein [Alteriqipengyuania lutimaris]